jgi:hypothetical protein
VPNCCADDLNRITCKATCTILACDPHKQDETSCPGNVKYCIPDLRCTGRNCGYVCSATPS